MSDFEFSVPVVVIGGGACGAVAALAALDEGAEVLLLERDAHPMGTTGMSMGVFCAAGTKVQAAAGVDDDAETFYADIIAKTRGETDPAIARAIAEESGPALDWLVERHNFPWELDTSFRPAYGNTRLRVHGWHGHDGQDMIELLHQKLSDEGAMVMYQARVTALVSDADGRVLGVEFERPGGEKESVGCDTLIIASGGFAASHDMLAQYIPEMADARNNGHEGSQGDGIRMGQQIGAAVGDMGAYQGYAMLADPQGISVPPSVPIDGGVLVNTFGQRFTDEKDDIAGMVLPVMEQPGDYVWVVFDKKIEQRSAHVPEMKQLIELNAVKQADSVAGLAQAINVDAAALQAALDDARAAQAEGRVDALGRDWSDGQRVPSGSLRAVKVVGAIYHTQGGLQIDREARVLREDGTPLPNVYAGGGAARSVSGPAQWGYLPAMGLCTAVSLGRLAGRNAAKQASSVSD